MGRPYSEDFRERNLGRSSSLLRMVIHRVIAVRGGFVS